MTVDELLQDVRRELRERADPKFAVGVLRFFKEYERVKAYGVRSASLHAMVAPLYRQVKGLTLAERNRFCTELWKSGAQEEIALACYIYRRFPNECGTAEFRLFERWLDRYVDNWGHCDGLSSWLFAASIANQPSLIADLAAWTRSKNRWRRRASAVALLQEAKKGRHTQEIFGIAALLLEDPDDMVQKGVGWLLKETYPKKPKETVKFLMGWRRRTSRLVLRYAAEKMSPADRAQVLG